jgi:hypothetical protein
MRPATLSKPRRGKLMEAESVIICAGCGTNRLCRQYKDIWLCFSGRWKCWRHREDVYAKYHDKGKG